MVSFGNTETHNCNRNWCACYDVVNGTTCFRYFVGIKLMMLEIRQYLDYLTFFYQCDSNRKKNYNFHILIREKNVLFSKMCLTTEHSTNHLNRRTDTDCGIKLYTVTTNHCVRIVRVTIEIYVSHNSDLRMETGWEHCSCSSITEIYWINIKFGVIPNECGIIFSYTNEIPINWHRNLCSN